MDVEWNGMDNVGKWGNRVEESREMRMRGDREKKKGEGDYLLGAAEFAYPQRQAKYVMP